MKIVTAGDVTLDRAWAAVDLARIADATVRLHWTDEPYVWHTNDGVEVFVVLDGAVDMHYRDGTGTHVTRLEPGRILSPRMATNMLPTLLERPGSSSSSRRDPSDHAVVRGGDSQDDAPCVWCGWGAVDAPNISRRRWAASSSALEW